MLWEHGVAWENVSLSLSFSLFFSILSNWVIWKILFASHLRLRQYLTRNITIQITHADSIRMFSGLQWVNIFRYDLNCVTSLLSVSNWLAAWFNVYKSIDCLSNRKNPFRIQHSFQGFKMETERQLSIHATVTISRKKNMKRKKWRQHYSND